MPAVPACLLDAVWSEFEPLLPSHPRVCPTHPLRCHRPRIPDRLVFEKIVEAAVHGSGYERIAVPGCSDRTIRRRLAEWARLGIARKVHAAALAAYDRMIGLEVADLTGDGCITKAPCGGDKEGPSPVDRRKQGMKRSVGTDGGGVPLGIVSAGANRHDSPLLDPTIGEIHQQVGDLPAHPRMHLDSGYGPMRG